MAKIKHKIKYFFSVEGETEQWYLKWLQDTINDTEEAAYNVSFNCKVEKNPLKRAKSLVVTGKTTIYHLSDYESSDEVHRRQFTKTMDDMSAAQKLGKQIKYEFGYSNLTFDLWIILHKVNCFGAFTHRKNYCNVINRAYNENFESMDEYKHEDNFKRCLKKLNLQNVIEAIDRANDIMRIIKITALFYSNIKAINIIKKILLLKSEQLLKKYLRIVNCCNITYIKQMKACFQFAMDKLSSLSILIHSISIA